MGDLPASDSPHPFDRIEFGGIGWQKDTHQAILIVDEKVSQIHGLVPAGVVQNKVYLPVGMLKQMVEKVAEGCSVECGGFLGKKASRFQVERSKIAYLLASGSRDHTRLLPLGGPHPDQTAVSLEMHLVLAPELNIGIVHPLVEVFLKTSCWRGSASRAWRRGLCKVNPSLWNSL